MLASGSPVLGFLEELTVCKVGPGARPGGSISGQGLPGVEEVQTSGTVTWSFTYPLP